MKILQERQTETDAHNRMCKIPQTEFWPRVHITQAISYGDNPESQSVKSNFGVFFVPCLSGLSQYLVPMGVGEQHEQGRPKWISVRQKGLSNT